MAFGRTDYAVVAVAALVIVDGLMSVPLWHLEQWAVALALGPVWLMAVKLAAVSALLWLWFGSAVDTTHVASKACVWCLTALYGFVVITNGLVLVSG